MKHILLIGDPMEPSAADMIAEIVTLPAGDLPSTYDPRDINHGWRCINGNERFNEWARIVLRYEISEEGDPE